MRSMKRVFRKCVAFLLVILMAFENPASTLAAETDVIYDDAADVLNDDYVVDGLGGTADGVYEDTVTDSTSDIVYADDMVDYTDVLTDSVSAEDPVPDMIMDEPSLSQDVINEDIDTVDTVSDNILSEDLCSEDTYDYSADKYDVPSLSDNSLLYELDQYRSENVKVYERADHSMTAFCYSEPVNYKDEEGNYQTIDNRLRFAEADDDTEDTFDGYTNTAAPFDVRFAQVADESRLFTIEEDKYKVSFAYIPSNESEISVNNEIADGGDLDITDTVDKVSEDTVAADDEVLADTSVDTIASDVVEDTVYVDDTVDAVSVSDDTETDNTVSADKVADVEPDDTDETEALTDWHRRIVLKGTKENKNTYGEKTTDSDPEALAQEVLGDAGYDKLGEGSDEDRADAADNEEVPDTDEAIPVLPKAQTVLYEEVETDADLEYQVENTGVKETVVAYSSSAPSSYTFKMQLSGLNASLKNGDIILSDKSGKTVYEIPAPEVIDAASVSDEGACYKLTDLGNGVYDLSVNVTPAWLKAADRAYPVRIDPTIKRFKQFDGLSALGDFVSICSDGTRDKDKLKVGRELRVEKGVKKYVTYRTYMNPEIPVIDKGSVVTEAKMRVTAGSASQLFYILSVPDKWSSDTISARSQPFRTKTFKDSLKNITDYGKNGGEVILDITKDVKEIKAGNKAGNGWCFVSEDENAVGVREVKPFKSTDKPFLEITYRDFTGNEDYYSAHSASVGDAGTMSINDFTGRLTFKHLDAVSTGERMPLSISHIYDIAYGDRLGEGKWLTAAQRKSAYGESFRLSMDVRLLVPAGETDIKTWPYVLIDSDGTKHYFKSSNVTYFVNGAAKTASGSDLTYPAAKDEDGLGLFVVPVTESTLKNTYPLKVVDKSGSMSMYFDRSGYLWKICDSNLREDKKNATGKNAKSENAIKISYENGSYNSSRERDEIEDYRIELLKIHEKAATSEMLSHARTYISKLEDFENESINVSASYKIASHIQKAKDYLRKIPDGDKEANYKNDIKNAAEELKKALDAGFIASTQKPVRVTDASGRYAELTYDLNGRLVSISDPYENNALVTYEYDKSGRLIKIVHPNGLYAAYTYDTKGHLIKAADQDGNRMDFTYGGLKNEPNDEVVKYIEYISGRMGQTVLVDHSELNSAVFTFSGNDEKTGTKDDIENVYTFDDKGRTTAVYSRRKSTGEAIGGALREYTDEEQQQDAANKVKEEVIVGSQVINLLSDGSFEKEKSKNGDPAWLSFNTCTNATRCHTVKIDYTDKYMGSRSGHVKLADAAGHDGRTGFRQRISAPAAGEYTASVYVKTKGLKNAKVRISVSTSKKSAESSDDKDSEEGSTLESEEGSISDENQLESNDGFRRMEATIKANKGETILVELSLSGEGGEAWFDCAQLNTGTFADIYNMIPYSSFEDGFKANPSLPGIPSGFAYATETVKEGENNTDDESGFPDSVVNKESAEAADPSCVKIVSSKELGNKVPCGDKALMIKGSPIKRRSILINPNFGSEVASYTFSCYVKADCAPARDKRKCGVYIGGSDAAYLEDNASGKYVCKAGEGVKKALINTSMKGWQYLSISLPASNWKGRLIEVRFDYESGTLCLDGLMLTKNGVKTMTYTSSGRLQTEQKGERTTKYTSDERDRRKNETSPGGAVTSYTYDADTNDLKSEKHNFTQTTKGGTDALTTNLEYDEYGNQVKSSEESAGKPAIVTKDTFDEEGRFSVSETDSRGNEYFTRYDSAKGLVTQETDPYGIITDYTYDKYANITGIYTPGAGASFTYEQKNHDRLKSIDVGTDKDTDKISFTYDAYGNVKMVSRLGRDRNLISHTYMANNGKLKQTAYGNGNRVMYGYDDEEQLISESWGGKDVVKYDHDSLGNVARVTDGLNKYKYRYYYDDQGRITNASVTDEAAGKEVVAFQNVYDKAGRPSVFAYYTQGRAFRSEYGYSSDDKVNSARLPSGGVFNRTYDGYDRIVKDAFTPQQMAETGEKTARGKGAKVESSYTYLDTDRKEADGKTVRGNTTTYKYTTRLLSGLETTVGTGANRQDAIKETLSYDDLNRVADHNGIVYTYDDLGRLIKARDKAKDRTWEYSYDSLGNITGSIFYDKGVRQEETYKYDKQNLIDYNKEAISSYNGGNPKLYRGNNLTWQHGKQLNSIKPRLLKNANSVSDPVDYTYTHEGIRLSKTVGKKLFNSGTRTDYILNGSLILAEKISRKGEEDEVLSYYYTAEGKLVEIGYKKGDEKENHYSVIRNAMGDVTALYTAEGILVGSYEYDPYGKLLAETPNTAFEDKDGILIKNPFRYRGYYYDKETGWYYLQSRYYDPQIKRFINADTTDLLTTDCENLMQYNLFMYCNGDPVNGYDPSGHFSLEELRRWAEGSHPIFFVSCTYNSATGANLLGGYQKVYDPLAVLNDPLRIYGEQYFIGTGVAAGASEKVGLGIGMMWAGEIADLENYGTEIGGSITAGSGFGGGMIISGEEGKQEQYYGGYISIGGGASLEGHVNLLQTFKTNYPIENCVDFYNLIQQLFVKG